MVEVEDMCMWRCKDGKKGMSEREKEVLRLGRWERSVVAEGLRLSRVLREVVCSVLREWRSVMGVR